MTNGTIKPASCRSNSTPTMRPMVLAEFMCDFRGFECWKVYLDFYGTSNEWFQLSHRPVSHTCLANGDKIHHLRHGGAVLGHERGVPGRGCQCRRHTNECCRAQRQPWAKLPSRGERHPASPLGGVCLSRKKRPLRHAVAGEVTLRRPPTRVPPRTVQASPGRAPIPSRAPRTTPCR